MGEEELKAIVHQYIKENLAVVVSTEDTWGGQRVAVTVYIGEDEISHSYDAI